LEGGLSAEAGRKPSFEMRMWQPIRAGSGILFGKMERTGRCYGKRSCFSEDLNLITGLPHTLMKKAPSGFAGRGLSEST
jgi:hypothetical protein